MPLAGVGPDDVALRVDQTQRRPGTRTVGFPDALVGVVDDRMADFVAQDGLADAFGVLLVFELGRVDADDDQFVGILLLQLGQVGQNVHAVDAAQRPEIEQDDLAAEVLQTERAGRVEPGDAALQFWHRDATTIVLGRLRSSGFTRPNHTNWRTSRRSKRGKQPRRESTSVRSRLRGREWANPKAGTSAVSFAVRTGQTQERSQVCLRRLRPLEEQTLAPIVS